MDIFNEILWPQFIQLNEIRNLPLTEQVNRYNQYIYELNEARHSWVVYQNKGPISSIPEEIGFLLQEDLFDLEQEDGSKILIK